MCDAASSSREAGTSGKRMLQDSDLTHGALRTDPRRSVTTLCEEESGPNLKLTMGALPIFAQIIPKNLNFSEESRMTDRMPENSKSAEI